MELKKEDIEDIVSIDNLQAAENRHNAFCIRFMDQEFTDRHFKMFRFGCRHKQFRTYLREYTRGLTEKKRGMEYMLWFMHEANMKRESIILDKKDRVNLLKSLVQDPSQILEFRSCILMYLYEKTEDLMDLRKLFNILLTLREEYPVYSLAYFFRRVLREDTSFSAVVKARNINMIDFMFELDMDMKSILPEWFLRKEMRERIYNDYKKQEMFRELEL